MVTSLSLTAALLCFFLLFFLGFKVLDEPHSYVTPGTGGLLLLSRMVVVVANSQSLASVI